MEIPELIEAALRAREKAAAPYSRFAVGAVVVTRSGRQFSGCNIEVSSYGLTMCAERVALFSALAEGEKEFDTLVVVADTSGVCLPCGACRQVIHEYAPQAQIVCANVRGDFEIHSTESLLPRAFGSSDLPP